MRLGRTARPHNLVSNTAWGDTKRPNEVYLWPKSAAVNKHTRGRWAGLRRGDRPVTQIQGRADSPSPPPTPPPAPAPFVLGQKRGGTRLDV